MIKAIKGLLSDTRGIPAMSATSVRRVSLAAAACGALAAQAAVAADMDNAVKLNLAQLDSVSAGAAVAEVVAVAVAVGDSSRSSSNTAARTSSSSTFNLGIGRGTSSAVALGDEADAAAAADASFGANGVVVIARSSRGGINRNIRGQAAGSAAGVFGGVLAAYPLEGAVPAVALTAPALPTGDLAPN